MVKQSLWIVLFRDVYGREMSVRAIQRVRFKWRRVETAF